MIVLFSILLLTVVTVQEKLQIFINYGVDREGIQLYQFLHGIEDGFYVDIGCYDSIFASNTLNLQVMGWSGINIDANPYRLARFIYSRPWEPSLNYAIGDEDQFVTLYELAEDSSSTISPKVKELVKGYKPLVKQINVPSITMKQLCQRFFYRRPTFLNLDIEGVGSKALQSNDWNNINCVPELIFSQINQQAITSGLPLAAGILQKHGYKKWQTNVGLNQIYVHQSVYEKYTLNYRQGQQLMQRKRVKNVGTVGMTLASRLGLNTILATHHQPRTDNIFYHFTKPRQIIDIAKENKYSNQISDRKNRPILILHFNPQNNYILLKDGKYESSVLNLGQQDLQFNVIQVKKDNGQQYKVFIYNHNFNTTEKPRIITSQFRINTQSIQHNGVPLQDIKKQNLTTNDKLLLSASKQLHELNQLITRSNQLSSKMQKQLLDTLSVNHIYNQRQIQILTNKIQNIVFLNQEVEGSLVKSQIQLTTSPLKENIASLMRLTIILLFAIFFSFLIVNVVICVAYQVNNEHFDTKKRKYRRKLSGSNPRQFEHIPSETTVQNIQIKKRRRKSEDQDY